MEEVGYIKYTKGTGIQGDVKHKILFDGTNYKISLGLFGEDSKTCSSVYDIELELREYYKQDKKFYIKEKKIDTTSFFQAVADDEYKKRDDDEKKRQFIKDAENNKKQKNQDIDAEIQRETEGRNTTPILSNINGEGIVKFFKYILLLIVNIVKNLGYALLHSLLAILSKKSEKLVMKYYWLAVKDTIILFSPFIVLFLIMELLKYIF